MTVRILTGDCRDVLRSLPDESVHCCVTSPPYFGLRDYGTGQWDGGDPLCSHASAKVAIGNSPSTKSTLTTNNGHGPRPGDKFSAGSQCGYRKDCHCGARRIDRQIGLEPTPEDFTAEIVSVFAELRRVLRSDGTVWLNLGDSYAGNGTNRNGLGNSVIGSGPDGACKQRDIAGAVSFRVPVGMKPKDLIGIPWRVAFALQADGWYLRQDIIWSKPNPMPESVRDRCTKAHEYIFLLSKSERYFYDATAIAEDAEYTGLTGQDASGFKDPESYNGKYGQRAARGKALTSPRNDGNTWNENNGRGFLPTSDKRNKRSVWSIPTSPFPDAHFATFPPALIEPCILAGCPKGGTVLDPFGGAGTTGLVADRLQRDAILIELNPEYAAMAERRICNEGGFLCDVQTEPSPIAVAAEISR